MLQTPMPILIAKFWTPIKHADEIPHPYSLAALSISLRALRLISFVALPVPKLCPLWRARSFCNMRGLVRHEYE
jgi:hypothetical protein